MKNYRVKVRDEKADFFEELLRYLDFCDYEKVEGFAEPRIYPNFEIHAQGKNQQGQSRKGGKYKEEIFSDPEKKLDNLREVMAKIDAIRDKSRRS
jgi:hypothetical protein